MIRALVVDDSPTLRELLVATLGSDPAIEVVGVAAAGDEAVEKALRLRPDIITMDIQMPRFDGIAAIRAIMRTQPTPIVVLCATSGRAPADAGFNALKAGALEVIEKPHIASPDELREFRRRLIATVKLMAEVHVVRVPFDDSLENEPIAPDLAQQRRRPIDAVGVCSSTGGPVVLEYLFRHLPDSFPCPIVVVQHITEGFLTGLVEWLDRTSRLEVVVASEGEMLTPGKIYFAPEHRHLVVAHGGLVLFSDEPPIRSHRPSGDVLFRSLALTFGGRAMGVMLTGMGEDGADSLALLARAGGIVLAQDEATSTIYGMPRAVVEREAATEVLPLEHLAERMVYWAFGGPLREEPGS